MISELVLAQTTEQYLFIGTYTKKTSEGIYVYKFNTKIGEATYVSTFKGIKNPSFLALNPKENTIYAVSETSSGMVEALNFDKSTEKLSLINSQSSGGADPCYITLDKTYKWALVGNYSSGNLSIFPVNNDGSLGESKQKIQHEGTGPNKERQEAPHVHSVNIAPNNKDIFVADLGIDKLMKYQLDAQTGELSKKMPVNLPAGAGPRHFEFHPNGKYAYVINELQSTITAFEYKNGTLKPLQTITTLPKNYSGKNSCADLHISSDGKFLYGSNRFHDSIVIYKVSPTTGKLAILEHEFVKGKTPRNFMIDPTGKFLLVANQDSDNITIFTRNSKTGKLAFTGKEISISMPVCLKMTNEKI